ncbi:MAG: TusE/DsrC/DsvC family sulfur relay protein [Pseudomonadota bacterium]
MNEITRGKHDYPVDHHGFLTNEAAWDPRFAELTGLETGIVGPLNPEHWQVITFIRERFTEQGRIPTIYETCRAFRMQPSDLKRLFPEGYHRGACRLAGMPYHPGFVAPSRTMDGLADATEAGICDKTYLVDAQGFLMDPEKWDIHFAINKAVELKLPGGALTERHWTIVRYLRDTYRDTGVIPTVYRTCEDTGIDLESLADLFPDGYHRGAVKVAGLRL